MNLSHRCHSLPHLWEKTALHLSHWRDEVVGWQEIAHNEPLVFNNAPEVNYRFPASAAMMSEIGQAARNGIPYITPNPAICHEEARDVLNAPAPAPAR